MSKKMEKQKNQFKNLGKSLNVNDKIDSVFINKLSEEIKTLEGVIDVITYDMKYDEDDNIYFYNNTIRVIFGDTHFYGFKLEKFNTHDADVNSDKFIKHLEKSNNILDNYLSKIENIKNVIPNIKKVVEYIDSLNLENNINIKKVRYSHWNNQLMITIYKEFENL